MPGNEVGDRVHNFFPEGFPQGQHHSLVVAGNWPALSNNLGVGSERQTGVQSSNTKNYDLHNSDIASGHGSYPYNGQHGLNSTQSTLRTELAKRQSQNQQPNLNSHMYGNQFYHTRQDEANFVAVDTGFNQRLASGGSSFHDLQHGVGPVQQAMAPVRSEPSESPVSFDLFGGQQMNRQQSNMLQSLQRQQSGLIDIQQLQQQVMFMKMQNLQRQQPQQVDAQNTLNQVPFFSKVASDNPSPALENGTTNSGALSYPWAAELGNSNWLQRGSPVFQGSSVGFIPSNNGQAQHLMGFIPQQTDQSLFGVPVSSSRGSLNQLSQLGTDKLAGQPMTTFNGSFPVNQFAALSNQVSGQDGTSIPRQRSHGENFLGHAPSQDLTNAINMENLQQENTLKKGSTLQDFRGRMDLAIPSQTSQEKVVTQASSSQNEVGLDPTEERILFGSEDNVWAAFAKSPDMNGEVGNLFDGAGSLAGFPSIQGGTWSALMQSAVGEACSSDVGVQEECIGLNFHSTEIPSGNQNLMYNSGTHKSSSAEDNFHLSPSLTSVSVRPSDSTSMKNSCHNVQGHRFPYEPGQSLQANFSQRLVQSSEEGSKWSNFGQAHKSAAEANQIFRNTSHPLGTEKVKSVSSPLTRELGGARQSFNKSANLGVLGSAIPSGDAALSVPNENSSKCSQDNNQKKFIQREVVDGAVAWKSNPGSNSLADMEHLGSSVASPLVNSEVFRLHNSVAAPNSSTMRGGEENADPLVNSKVSEGFAVLQSHVTKDNQILHSSVEVKMHEMENSDKKDNSIDSYRFNLSPHSSTGGLRENILTDAGDSRCLLTGKQKSSNNQVGGENSWPRKFQYHPMGNMDEDVDPPYGMKQSTHSQLMVQQKPQHGESKVSIQVPKSQAELEEVQSPDVLRDGKGFSEVHSQSRFSGGVSSIYNRSLDLCSPNNVAESSPNMLQLLQKVDQSRECGSMAHFSTSEQKAPSKIPKAEDSAGSVGHLQRNQSSTSQGFSLQLGPPSQRISVQNHCLSSQSPIQGVSSSHSSHAAIEFEEKSRGLVPPPHQAQSLLPLESLLENNRFGVSNSNEATLHTMSGKFDSVSGFPYSRSQIKNSHVIRDTGQVSTNQPISVSFDKHAPCSTEKGDSCRESASGQSAEASLPDGATDITRDFPVLSAEKPQLSKHNASLEIAFTNQVSSKDQMPVSQPSSMSGISHQGMSSKMLSSKWTNFQQPPHPFGAQYSKEPSHFSQSHQLNIKDSSLLSAHERQGDLDSNRGNFTPEIGTSSVNSLGAVEGEKQRSKESPSQQVPLSNVDLVQNMDESQGREPIVKYLSEGSPAKSSSVQKDIEAFGRSLKPKNFSHQNYSLLNQMQEMKHVEADPSNRGFKRMRVPDSSPGAQEVPSADCRMLGFSGPVNLQRSLSSQQVGKMAPQDILAFRDDDSQSSAHYNNTNPEQTQISQQMVPSWFNQCGTLKNGQMLQMYDACSAATTKAAEQPCTLGKSFSGAHTPHFMQQTLPATADRNLISNMVPNSILSSAAFGFSSSTQTLAVNVDQQHTILKSTKQKNATSELTPWYKEVSLDSQRNQTLSLAENEWANAANRPTEKVEQDIGLIEDGRPRLKAKRRLILTTQLMQQLYRPPPVGILYADAYTEYESVAFTISRLALGDACSMTSCSNGDLHMLRDDNEPLPDKCNTSQRNDKHHFAKAIEELGGRARRLESDFLRLDKRASVLDVIVEGQDLEKFSVINRFAKFHGRPQSDCGETPSSSDAAAHILKPFPQRYVTALPIPKNLPNGVQGLSL